MLEPDRSTARFSDSEADELIQYRQVSRLAVASLVLGALSPAALIHPFLWLAPTAAMAAGAGALWAIAADQSRLSGRKAALWGLALASLFGGCATARHYTHRQTLYQQADAFTQQWFELLRQNRLEEAYQLHMPLGVRAQIGSELRKPAANKASEQSREEDSPEEELDPTSMTAEPESLVDPRQEMDDFFGRPPLDTLVAHAKSGRLQLQRNKSQGREATGINVVQHYHFHYKEGGRPRTLPVEFCFKRSNVSRFGEADWWLEDVNEISDSAT
jgi:hypothetical protein